MKKPDVNPKQISSKKAVAKKKPVPAKEIEKKLNEISEKSLLERQLLDEMFSTSADAQAESDKRRRKEREATIVLLSGKETSLNQIHERFVVNPQPYRPLFPNDNKFFTEALRVHGFSHLDPKVYVKPSCIRDFIIKAIYSRFYKSKELLRAIRDVNPILPNGFRLYKLYQHLDDNGQKEVEQYREDANEIMSVCANDYECKKILHSRYGISCQLDAFKE